MDLAGLGVDLMDLGADLVDLEADFVRKGIVRKGGTLSAGLGSIRGVSYPAIYRPAKI